MSNQSASSSPCQIKAPLVVTIVGPPCRGKSLAAHKISRNLFWKGENVKGENEGSSTLITIRLNVHTCFPFSLVLVFKVEEAASTETLKNVTEWFNTQHNVAVSIEHSIHELEPAVRRDTTVT
jgi:DNA polymerase III delta prime subunit